MKRHTFKLKLTFNHGLTAGDMEALLEAFEREVVEVSGLEVTEQSVNGSTLDTVFRFREQLSDDAMHDVCRTVLRWMRRRYWRAIHSTGITDRTWWKPSTDPNVDNVDPLLDAMVDPVGTVYG